MLFISEQQVAELFDLKSCIGLMKDTLCALSKGEASQVLRVAMEIEERKILGLMPASIPGRTIAGAKIITVFPDNFKRGMPSHQGLITLFDADTGALKAVVEAEAITGVRTAAVSALATDYLARKNAEVLCILGSGLQARKHLEAISYVRDIKAVYVWDINKDSLKKFKEEMSAKFPIPIHICTEVSKAVENADIICTVTSAKNPILFGKDVKKGAHINAVGACTPDCRELDTEIVKKSRVFGDRIESTLAESGDFLIPLSEGAITKEHLLGELGDVILGNLEGRKNDEDTTIFEALGLAVEDLASADYIAGIIEKNIRGE
ncbi:ornithine cyclodeaminase family protein [Anaeropeptidivorans aminofermentans]|uniref:ornithine cyclodeaminase family protein n=1 Tax=Anaeropeptidivorans aminofermentans TaxID=2934315 RepID=UPI002025012F|nr:ornithine cyclodeaminase family protein [Anaeropeptidivorans aminofermentans]